MTVLTINFEVDLDVTDELQRTATDLVVEALVALVTEGRLADDDVSFKELALVAAMLDDTTAQPTQPYPNSKSALLRGVTELEPVVEIVASNIEPEDVLGLPSVTGSER